jgi:hypothetical protein
MDGSAKRPFQKIPNNIINNKQECPLVDDEEDPAQRR